MNSNTASGSLHRPGLRALGLLAFALALGVAGLASMFFGKAGTASAHCDSANGPVVNAAKHALETGDVKYILPYVKQEQEGELTAAFDHAYKVHRMGGEAQAIADRYFYETAVRLHRQGEGASYTGLKDAEELPPALEAAEHALESGELNDVYHILDEQIRAGVEEHYQAVVEAREAELKKPSVENARARVEAEFSFEKFILGISDAASAAGHAESEGDAPASGHEH